MEKEIVILSPLDGDMLNERDGSTVDGCLLTQVRVSAPPCSVIQINGTEAVNMNGEYSSEIRLHDYRNTIEVFEKTSGYRENITVYWLKNYAGKYRLSLDDNIWFLKDIAFNANKYRSIFENPYLGFLKRVYNEFGTKIHINIYYMTEGFNLSQMPSKYKKEWKENAEWLKLSFHALQNEPDKPYTNAGYEEMRRDCKMVMEQVSRFAGEELMGPVTTLHWGEATVEGCRALRDLGYKCQAGDFNVDNDLPPVSYYLDVEKRRHINRRFIWKDNREDIIFTRCAIVINCHKLKGIRGFLDEILKDPHKSGYMDLLIHEQYFYPNYIAYQSDYREKVLTSVRWAVEKGYKPAFLSECVF
jgi:hypothetical protein